jgi:hypothetical protein
MRSGETEQQLLESRAEQLRAELTQIEKRLKDRAPVASEATSDSR